MDAHGHGPDDEAERAPETRPRSGPRRRRYVALAAAALALVIAGTAGAVVVFDDDSGYTDGSPRTAPSGGTGWAPTAEPGKGPIGPRVELDCPAPIMVEHPVPAPLDPRATAGNPHTLANGAVAARLCEPPPPVMRGGPPTATRVSPLPATVYYDVDRVVRKVNSYPEGSGEGPGPGVACPADARSWLTLEVLYPGGVRASIPVNLGGCGEMVFSDMSRHMARGFDGYMTVLLEEQRVADPPVPPATAPVCEQSRPAGRVPLRRESLGWQRDVVPYPAAQLVACQYAAVPDGTWALRGSVDLAAQREEIRALVNAAVPGDNVLPWPNSVRCPYPTEGFTLLEFADAAGARYEVLVVGGPCAHMYLMLRSETYGGENGAPVPADLLRRLGL
ncbi:hypothetical protein OG216_11760 [Streptomycetaceae bacterium NBC_01309]